MTEPLTDYSAWRFWLDLFEFTLISGVSLWVYLTKRQQVTEDRLKEARMEIDLQLDDHGTRITRVEEAFRYSPTHDDIAKVHTRLDTVSEKISDLAGEFRAARRVLELVNQHLMDKH